MSCSAEQIAEKKRQAQEKLKQKKHNSDNYEQQPSTSKDSLVTSPTGPAKSFYGGATAEKTQVLSKFESKIKNQNTHAQNSRILSQPYSNRINKTSANALPSNQEKSLAPVFKRVVTCTCVMISEERFEVIPSSFHAQLIDIFKTITTRKYDNNTKVWSFHLKDYESLQEKISHLNPDVVIGHLPKFVLNLLRQPRTEIDCLVLGAIEPKLRDSLLSFQKEGVCFGIDKQGRCMIADDMGLGKTYQALAIADFYKDDWPLLVCTTAATRDVWAEQIRKLLPAVPTQYITVLTATTDYFGDAKALIVSYPLMEKNYSRLCEKKFGCLILDESHTLKNFKTKAAKAASCLAKIARRVIMLTGTPAVSRPVELFTQLDMIDNKFFTFKEYTQRYCAAKQTTFGWDAKGQSNLNELNIILKRKFMIRRTKDEVEFELGEKSRETVQLDPSKVFKVKDGYTQETIENLKEYSNDIMKLKGKQREEVLLKFYAETAKIKASAVCSYLKGLVKDNIKFIVFAHHQFMLNAISECLRKISTNFIRIDGTTKNDLRTKYVHTFQTSENCRVAVLSLKACNAGITLTAAKMVVFAELDWNPSTLAQAEARAHRIGQEDHVICRYLLATGTADDYIWPMVQRKQNILNKAGLFSEDLSDAIHSAAEIPESNLLTQYFTTSPKEKPIASTSSAGKENNNNCSTDNQNDLHSMLDDGNDDDFMELDF